MIGSIDRINCPLCGSNESRAFDQRTFRGMPVVNRLCAGCGMVYQSPRMSQEELDQFYEATYRQLYQGNAAPVQKDLAVQKARAAHIIRFTLANGIDHLGRYLDVGSSAGLLMQAFAADFGCQTVGVEPGKAYLEAAQASGLKVYPGIETLTHQDEACFDLISLVHVLEHLPDPVGTLTGLRKDWLAPGGWLLVEVPNLYCHDCFEVAHLASYSAHTLEQTVMKAGFQVTSIKKHGKPRSDVLPLNITLLAQPLPDYDPPRVNSVRSETGVWLKRNWGFLKRRALERLLPGQAWHDL